MLTTVRCYQCVCEDIQWRVHLLIQTDRQTDRQTETQTDSTRRHVGGRWHTHLCMYVCKYTLNHKKT